ncbi:FAD/NAD-binding domain-containing protein [Phellopilus nigrolimitatus]|nr:FAD/NAD-binding domain-containing protein [Phellopilus nigrolimitatus]
MTTAPASKEQPELALPTLERLKAELPKDIDAKAVASQWFDQFSRHLKAGDTAAVVPLLLDDAFWRDMLALTWDFRTFHGSTKIMRFLTDVLASSTSSTGSNSDGRVVLSNFKLDENQVVLQTPYSDLVWVQGMFTFETSTAQGSGVFRLVPTSSGVWKAHVVYTNLEGLKGFPERIGTLRSTASNHGDDWLADRKQELEFVDSEPAVVIIGGGHCGLGVAARLKYLGVPTLIVERNARIGDSWRLRYEALSLHDPVCECPPTWPLWTPAPKIANWLESYAETLELNVWTSTDVKKIEEGGVAGQGPWKVHISRADGQTRVLKPRHVVFATGLFGGPPRMPTFPGMIVHTTQYKTAREHKGKKVVIVGACTSGHDVALDHAKQDVDVTILQRGSTYIMSVKHGITRFNSGSYWEDTPPADISDRVGASYPHFLVKLMHQRLAPEIAEMDKDLLEGLRQRGFKLNMGEDGSGVIMLYIRRGGGFYFDTGASQMIVEGKIKLKNDSLIQRFTKDGIEFENGSSLPADVIILATGYENAKELVRTLVNDDVAERLKPIWALNDEGELNSVFRYCGVPGLYFAMGEYDDFEIKAQEEGLHGKRYTA